MRTMLYALVATVLVAGAAHANRAPVVSNVQAAQRAGTMLVDVTYDVYDADGDALTITLQMSNDGGQTWRVSVATFEAGSDEGSGVTSGTGKRIVWNAGADVPDSYGTNWRPKVIASDGQSSGGGGTTSFSLPNGVSMEFVWIEPGTFTMGSPDSDSYGQSYEKPQHEVTISQGFWLGKYEITQGEWEAVVGSNPSYYQGSSRPVEQVSWNGVQSFVDVLNDAAGSGVYRLPTEAEWEYACRAGTTTRWSFGDTESDLGDYAWYSGNNSPSGTKDVGMKLANPWGLFDMHGNVYEWVQDWWGSYSSGSQVDPEGPSTGSGRVIRGGGFGHHGQGTRSAYRYSYSPGDRFSGPAACRGSWQDLVVGVNGAQGSGSSSLRRGIVTGRR